MNKGGLKGIKGFPQIKGDQINFPLDKEQRGTLRFFYPDFLSPDSSPNTISRSMQSSLRSLIPNKYADVDYKGIPEGNSTAINHTTVSMLQYKNPPKNAKYISQQVGKIVFGNGVFLATNSLAINISTNGVIWTTSSLALANTVAFGNGIFVAGTTTGGFLTSTDGTSWTTSASSQFPATSVNSIEYGNSLWTAVGLNGSINVSTDNGTTWTTRTSNFGATSVNTVAFGNGIFVAGASGSAGLRTSTDGITWTSRASSFGSTSISSLAYLNGLWLAGGPAGKFSTSTDGISWNTANLLSPSQIFSIAYGDSKYVIGIKNSTVRYSTNLTDWSFASEELLGTGTHGNLGIFGVYGNGISIIWVTSPVADIRKSTDESKYYENVESFGGSTTITNLLFGQGKFVLNSAGIWKTSTDAISWTTISTPALTPSKWFGNAQKWVNSTGTAFSTDLTTWVTSGLSVSLPNHLSYNPYAGKWVYSSGISATMYLSTDAVTWTTALLPWIGGSRTFTSTPIPAPTGNPAMNWWNGYQTIFKGSSGLYLGNTEASIWSTDLITFAGASITSGIWYYNANAGSQRINMGDVFVSEQGNNSGSSQTWNGTDNFGGGINNLPGSYDRFGTYVTRGYSAGEYLFWVAGSNTMWAQNGAENNVYRYKPSDVAITINGLKAKVVK